MCCYFLFLSKAKKKPIEKLSPEELGVDVKPRFEILSTEEPPPRKGGQKVASVQELVDALKKDGLI